MHMKYQEYKQHLEAELNSLNWAIDEKILRGLSYSREAKRHRELIKQARRERRRPFFARVFSYVSLF
jgi:hypothetical protein